MKMIQKISALLLVAITMTACNSADGSISVVHEVSTQIANKTEIARVLTFSSNVEGNRETILSAKAPGQIANIEYEIGDPVSNGTLIASLTAEVDSANYGVAKTAKASVEKNLDTTATLFDKKIEEAKVAVLTATENLNRAKNTKDDQLSVLEEQLNNAQLNVDLAKLNYDNIEKSMDQQEENTLGAAESAVVQALIMSKSVNSYLYGLKYNPNPSNDEETETIPNYDYNDPKSFRLDPGFNTYGQDIASAESAVMVYRNKTQKFENYYDDHIRGKNPTQEELEMARDLAKDTVDYAKDTLQLVNTVFSNSTANDEMTDAELNTYRSSLFPYASQIESVNLSAGSTGAQGLVGIDQSLASLEVTRQNQLDQAQKQVEIAEQNYQTLKESMDATTNDMSSQVKLMALYLNQSANALATAQAQKDNQLAVLQSQVDQAQSQMNLAGAMLANTKIYAPYSGVIAEKYLDEGTVVGAGMPVMKIVDVSSLKLVIFVPENQIKYFEVGQKGMATSESFPGEGFETTVERISPKVEQGSKKVRVELSISDPESVLKIGMYMNLKMSFDSEDKVLALPISAVQNFYGEESVFVNENGVAVRKPVATGITSGNYIEIVTGIEPGDEVIIKGLSDLRDGDKITVTKNNE